LPSSGSPSSVARPRHPGRSSSEPHPGRSSSMDERSRRSSERNFGGSPTTKPRQYPTARSTDPRAQHTNSEFADRSGQRGSQRAGRGAAASNEQESDRNAHRQSEPSTGRKGIARGRGRKKRRSKRRRRWRGTGG